MKQKPISTIMLAVILAVSIFFNFSLYQEQKTAKERIEQFLPAAAQIETEIAMLRNNNRELLSRLTAMQMQQDSIKKMPSAYPTMNPAGIQPLTQERQPALPSMMIPPTTTGDFNDLQKQRKQ
jgi:predicted negative regulator of RcsB-dependent stress response